MPKNDRDKLLDVFAQVDQLSASAQQLIAAFDDTDIYNSVDQHRGYMKVMKEKLALGLEHLG